MQFENDSLRHRGKLSSSVPDLSRIIVPQADNRNEQKDVVSFFCESFLYKVFL